VEVGGVGTLERSFQAVAPEGKIGLIGVLSDGENPNPHLLMQRSGHLHGIYVGTIDQPLDSFRAMNAAIDVNALQPVVDRTFSLDEVSEAYRALEEAEHFGKIVVTI
jgi:NADPH:quinone reductase-like Zn-dependent oxidoreductase